MSGEPLSIKCASDFFSHYPTADLICLMSTTETGDTAACKLNKDIVAQLVEAGHQMCPIGTSRWLYDCQIDKKTGELIVSGTMADSILPKETFFDFIQ